MALSIGDWAGIAGLAAIIVTGVAGAIITSYATKKAGLQKVAEARLAWSDRYKDLSIELDRVLLHLERYYRPGRLRSIALDRHRVEARQLATEMFYMINPDSLDEAARHEEAMEMRTLSRLARVGVSIDMEIVRCHRRVLKHNWRRAKSEL